MTAPSIDAWIAALTGAGAGGVILKLLDIAASRRQTSASADVTLSAEARQWVESFRAEMAAMATRHREELGIMASRIDGLEARLSEREARIKDLEDENMKLEREVKRLMRRVSELESEGRKHTGAS